MIHPQVGVASSGAPPSAPLVAGALNSPLETIAAHYLLLIHLLQQNEEVGARIVRDIISSRTVAPEQWEELQRALREHRSIEYANGKLTVRRAGPNVAEAAK